MQEETFGPVIPVVTFGDVEQAIALANDSQFGLSAAVFSGDPAPLWMWRSDFRLARSVLTTPH